MTAWPRHRTDHEAGRSADDRPANTVPMDGAIGGRLPLRAL